MAMIAITCIVAGVLIGYLSGRFIQRRWLRYIAVLLGAAVAFFVGAIIGVMLGKWSGYGDTFAHRAMGQGGLMGLAGCLAGAWLGSRKWKPMGSSGNPRPVDV